MTTNTIDKSELANFFGRDINQQLNRNFNCENWMEHKVKPMCSRVGVSQKVLLMHHLINNTLTNNKIKHEKIK